MSRPLVTAILLEELYRAGSEIRLVKGSLVTPAARDWMKEHAVPITWDEPGTSESSLAVVMDQNLPEMRAVRRMLDRRGGLKDVIEPMGGRRGVPSAVRKLCGKIARREVTKGVVFVQDAPVPLVIANKHNRVRAAQGIDIPTVEEACRELGINVLVIEYLNQSAYQMEQMIDRFVKGPTAAQPEIGASIEVIESGGGRADW
jgi:ribose 5-phosphate isomerase RpiB